MRKAAAVRLAFAVARVGEESLRSGEEYTSEGPSPSTVGTRAISDLILMFSLALCSPGSLLASLGKKKCIYVCVNMCVYVRIICSHYGFGLPIEIKFQIFGFLSSLTLLSVLYILDNDMAFASSVRCCCFCFC